MTAYTAGLRLTSRACWLPGISSAPFPTLVYTSIVTFTFIFTSKLFGHIAQLNPDVPAHQAVRIQTDLSTGRKPDVMAGRPRERLGAAMDWRRMSARNYWDACIYRGHSGVTQRSTRASRRWRWWWWRRWWWWWLPLTAMTFHYIWFGATNRTARLANTSYLSGVVDWA